MSASRSQLALAGAALLVVCALCFQSFSTQQVVLLWLCSFGCPFVTQSEQAVELDGATRMLSLKDYSREQMKVVAKRIHLAEANEQVGYLRSGDSLPGMPLQFYEGTDQKHGHYTVRGQCEAACIDDSKCKAYTYLTVTGKCYLKSAVKPGLSAANTCDSKNCWYFGVITNK